MKRTHLLSLIVCLLASAGLACGLESAPEMTNPDEEPTPPSDEDPVEIEPSLVVTEHSTYPAGSDHVLVLEDADLYPADFAGFAIEADCGDGFQETGIVLSPEHPSAVFHESAQTGDVPDTDAEERLLAALETKHGIILAYAELLSPFFPETAYEECLETPGCGDQLAQLDAQWELADAEATAAMDEIDAAEERIDELILPEHAAACEFLGVALAIGPDGPPVVEVEELKPQGYDDWNKKVTIIDDPCEGKTPIECYRDKVEEYKKRACGEVDENGAPVANPPEVADLPASCRSICEAIKGGYVDFPDPECKRLGAAGMTVRSKDGKTPAPGLPGDRSEVRIDWKTLLKSPGSFLTFKHEMDHVVWFAETEDLVKKKKALEKEAADLLDQALAKARQTPPDMTAAVDLAMRSDTARKAAAALCAEFVRLALERILRREARAFELTIMGANDFIKGSPVSGTKDGDIDETVAVKQQSVTMLEELDMYLNKPVFKNVKVSAATSTEVCGRLAKIKTHLKNTKAGIDKRTIWECLDDPAIKIGDRFKNVEQRLGC